MLGDVNLFYLNRAFQMVIEYLIQHKTLTCLTDSAGNTDRLVFHGLDAQVKKIYRSLSRFGNR